MIRVIKGIESAMEIIESKRVNINETYQQLIITTEIIIAIDPLTIMTKLTLTSSRPPKIQGTLL